MNYRHNTTNPVMNAYQANARALANDPKDRYISHHLVTSRARIDLTASGGLRPRAGRIAYHGRKPVLFPIHWVAQGPRPTLSAVMEYETA